MRKVLNFHLKNLIRFFFVSFFFFFCTTDKVSCLQVLLHVRDRVLSEVFTDAHLATLHVNREYISNYLGLRMRDTCSSSLLGVVQASELENTTAASSSSKSLPCTPQNMKESDENSTIPLYSILGPASSEETAAISPWLSSQRISHISNWASSSEFDSRSDYPYLFRTVPTVNFQAKAIADLLEMFGWKYAALVYSSDVLYGVEGSQNFIIEADARSFCIPIFESFSGYDKRRVDRVIKKLQNDTKVRAIVLFALLEDAVELLKAMYKANVTDRIIIGSDDWINRLDYTDLPDEIRKLFQNSRVSVIGFSPRPINSALAQGWISNITETLQTPSLLKEMWDEDPFLRPFLEERLKCTLNTSAPYLCPGLEPENKYMRICDDSEVFIDPVPSLEYMKPFMLAIEVSITALITAVFRVATTRGMGSNPTRSEIFCQLVNTTLPCGEKYFVDGGGDPAKKTCHVFSPENSARPVYTVQNIQIIGDQLPEMVAIAVWSDTLGDTFSKRLDWLHDARIDWRSGNLSRWNDRKSWPSSVCSTTCAKGYWRHFYDSTLFLCCWDCVLCEPHFISNTTNADICYLCPLGFRQNSNHTACVEIEPSYLDQGNGWTIVGHVISAISVFLALITMFLFWKWRASPLVIASDLRITTAILVSMIIGSLLTGLLTGKPSDNLCKAQLILITPWPTFAVAGVLCKTNRLARIFNRKTTLSRGKFSRRLLGTPAQFILMVVLTVVQVLLTVAAVELTNPTAKKVYEGRDSVQLVCDWDTGWQAVTLSYNLLLIIVCLGLAYHTRKLPENYNEARLIFMAAFCVMVVWLGLSPAYFVTESELQPVIAALAVRVVFFAIWSCLYAPRLYVLFRHPEQRLRRQSTVKRLAVAEFRSSRLTSQETELSMHQNGGRGMHYRQETKYIGGGMGNQTEISEQSTESHDSLDSHRDSTAGMLN